MVAKSLLLLAYATSALSYDGQSVFKGDGRRIGKRSQSRTLDVPGTVPDDAGPVLNTTFPAFAFEARSLLFYAGNGTSAENPNTFSQNLMQAVASRTGVTPIVRVGGTSLDVSYYDPNQTEAVQYPNANRPNIPFGLVFGPSYFTAYHNLDASYIFDLPLAKNNLSGTILFANAGYNLIGAERISQFECGNEPNSYPGHSRPKTYSPTDYVRDWTRFTTQISENLSIPLDQPIWESCAITTHPPVKWQVPALWKDGLDKVQSRIMSVSVHYYQSNSGKSLQQTLMNHTTTVTKAAFLLPNINFTRSLGLPFNLGEVGSALNGKYNDMRLEGVLGSALWQVDFFMLMMSYGVNRINYQQGIGFGFSLWQPTPYKKRPPHVRAPYYGQVFAADFVGPSGNTQVVNFDQHSDTLAAYAAYDGGSLARIAIVNLRLWTAAHGNPRPSVNYTVALPSLADGSTVGVQRLMSPEGGRAMGETEISWAGQQWTYANDGVAVQVAGYKNETLTVQGGSVTVNVPASEAVMLFVQPQGYPSPYPSSTPAPYPSSTPSATPPSSYPASASPTSTQPLDFMARGYPRFGSQ